MFNADGKQVQINVASIGIWQEGRMTWLGTAIATSPVLFSNTLNDRSIASHHVVNARHQRSGGKVLSHLLCCLKASGLMKDNPFGLVGVDKDS
jgi:hypothetical protein